MTIRKKQIQLFMTSQDEKTFSEILTGMGSNVSFLDGNIWEGESPPLNEGIATCKENIVYIWSRKTVPDLPTFTRADGRREGPISGVVLQFVRSRRAENLLLSGRLAVGYDDTKKEFDLFVKSVFKLLSTFVTKDLVAVDPGTREVINNRISGYAAGPDAVAQVLTGTINFLRDRSTQNFFLPRVT